VAARLKGLVGERARVNLPGGTLSIEWPGSGPVMLAGPAEFVFDGRWLREVPRLEG
jgi:diaminopimelate epimerase